MRIPVKSGRAAALFAFLMALSSAAPAADPFYLGTWKIVAATLAPWAPTDRPPGTDEMKELTGKTVVFTPKEITGPRQVACKGPKYRVKDYPADMLFQGAFGEMQRNDKSVDPAKLAAKVGFQGKSWKTVETGCEIELDWHFINPTTTTFGLNDYVYTLKKQ